MPTDWTPQIDSTYNALSAKGAAIRIFKNESGTANADENLPWEGSATKPPHFDTYGVFLPFGGDLAASIRPNVQKVLIPAKGMDFELTGDMTIQLITDDDTGTVYKLSYPSVLAPDPSQPIMYTVQAELWPS